MSRLRSVRLILAAVFACSSAGAFTAGAEPPVSLGNIHESGLFTMAADGSRIWVVWRGLQGLNTATVECDGEIIADSRGNGGDDLSSGGVPRPRLLMESGNKVLFHGLRVSRHLGRGGEAEWEPLSPVAPSGSIVGAFDVRQGDGFTLVATASPTGVARVFRSSKPSGSFTEENSFDLLPEGRLDPLPEPGIAADGRSVDVVWAAHRLSRQGTRISHSSTLHHLSSQDGGVRWTRSTVDLHGKGSDAVIAEAKLTRFGNRLWVAYTAQGRLYVQSRRDGGTWSAPTVISQHEPRLLRFAQARSPVLLWVDSRFREVEWWARLPLSQVFMPDKAPGWQNNDLFICDLSRTSDGCADPLRLTKQLSYTDGLEAVATEQKLAVLRTGRSRVGYTLDQFGKQPELFMHIVPFQHKQETGK